jgi:hypothetical protein
VLTSDFKDYTFDLTLRADDFTLVNAPQSTDRIIYGKLNIDADAKIKGPMTSPTVNGDLRINKVTDFVLVLPQSDPEVVSRDGVVRFVDKDHPEDTVVANIALDSLSLAELNGIDVNAILRQTALQNLRLLLMKETVMH